MRNSLRSAALAMTVPGLLGSVAAPASPAAASPAVCWQPAGGCGFAVTAGRAYTISSAYRATATVRAVAYTYSAAAGWRQWFTGSPYGGSASWAPLATTTPVVPAGVERLGLAFTPAAAIRDVAVTAAPAPRRPQEVYRPGLGRGSGLVTDGFAYHNPRSAKAVRSAVWHVTTGSLFAVRGSGDTGSPVFRMHTVRADFTDVRVAFRLDIAYQKATSYTPESSYDGVHIWLRHRSQYELYAASVARRDGKVLIKKKCPGGPVNGGTYYTLGAELPGRPIVRNKWREVSATVRNNPGGSVTVVLSVDGEALVSAVDAGVGCAPIRAAAPVGIRGDNTRFRFTDVTVTTL
ncbi:hypothetical protein [Actinoplanes nipponensis]|uniref:3-keto-disaccharide hydrolase domain-containing protein n=1 Tax=Actinoplanes nipponensis TaxID=135950 RepID=A0A919MMW2_9ACTN|nr:hypothetical protein [Actinoplanes nipponensis]GIE47838.1 hypothetical protein Ani05nite_13720 [Actinoplanes nipponensis]